MPTVAGVVVNGRVELDEELPEGTRVRVQPASEEPVVLDEQSMRELAEAADSLDRGEGIPAEVVLERLARRRNA